MPAYQILSCYVIQDLDFENFYFVLILYSILGKVTKFLVEKLSTLEVISRKPLGGGGGGGGGEEKTPPIVHLGLVLINYPFLKNSNILVQICAISR